MPIAFVLSLAFLNGTSELAARVLLPLYALKLGAQPLTIGLLAAVFSVFPLLFAVQAGRIADRFGARWLLMFGSVAGGMAMLVPYYLPGIPAIFFAAAMIGLVDAIYSVSVQSLVGLLSHPRDRARNFNNFSLTASAFWFSGPLFAGFAIDLAGHASATLYLALLTLSPMLLLVLLGHALPASVPPASHSPARAGIRGLLSTPGVGTILVTSSLMSAGNSLYQFYLPVYATSIGISASTIGIILALIAVAMLIMRLAVPPLLRKYTAEFVLTCTFAAGATSLIAVPFFTDAATIATVSFVFGLCMGGGHPLMIMLMFNNSPKGRSGESLGLRMTANHLAKMVLPVMIGWVTAAFGIPPVFWLIALMLATGGVLIRRKSGSTDP